MTSDRLPKSVQWALALGCAISVGNLYYIQPLLTKVQDTFHVTSAQAGIAATFCQVGYALGMLFIVPLGDVFERRRLIVISCLASVVALLFVASAPTMPLLDAACLLVGITTCTVQIILPFAAHLAPPAERGRVVGFVMSGLLIGILLARTVGGFIGQALGWRAMFVVAAGMVLGLAFWLRAALPAAPPETKPLPYLKLLRSIVDLFKEEQVLRESAFFGAVGFAAFSAFWTTLAFFLAAPPFQLGPQAVGLFGLVGVAGALTAPVVGRLGDKRDARRTVAVGLLVLLASYGVMAIGARSLFLLVLGTLLLDIGTQAAHVSNQSRVFALRPDVRSRVNTVYMTSYFVGGSLGSAIGAWAWSVAGWNGVCSVGAVACLLGLGLHTANRRLVISRTAMAAE